jgi:y4mF family transcriptional regulator
MKVVESPDDLGSELRARRRELGITQQRLADVVGVNRRVLGELERGKRTVRLEIAISVARALGLDIALVARSQ